jgi:acetate kinase
MKDAIVVLNADSSSIKFSVYQIDEDDLSLAARGQIEEIGTSPHFVANDGSGATVGNAAVSGTSPCAHQPALAHLLTWIGEHFKDSMALRAVGHRIVHGGCNFIEPTLIDDSVLARLEQLTPLAPMHQPHSVAAVNAATALRPDLPQVACFDTAFHRGRAEVTERFGLPDEMFQRGVRRWGFHGLSYASIIDQLKRTAPGLATARLIVAHLGSQTSMCAIKGGRSVDTTMSFCALDGLPMGTHCGRLDPGAVLFLKQSCSVHEVETLLWKKSGLLGISGVSGDICTLLASTAPRAAAAIDFFVYHAMREIASLTAALGGLDALIFSGAAGENSPVIRSRICKDLGWLGIALHQSANERGRGCLSPPGQTPSVWVVPSDEERLIASSTLAVLRAKGSGGKGGVAISNGG